MTDEVENFAAQFAVQVAQYSDEQLKHITITDVRPAGLTEMDDENKPLFIRRARQIIIAERRKRGMHEAADREEREMRRGMD